MKFSTADGDDDLDMLEIPDTNGAHHSESDTEMDVGSNQPLQRFANAPLAKDRQTTLLFALNPSTHTGMMFETEPTISGPTNRAVSLFEFQTLGISPSLAYHEYLIQLYKHFEFLGDVSRYREPVIGLVSQSNEQDTQNLNRGLGFVCAEVAKLCETGDAPYDLLILLKCLGAECFALNENERCQQIFEWINMADGEPSSEFASDIMEAAVPCHHPEFWTLVLKLVTRGLFDEAHNALEKAHFEFGPESPLGLVLIDLSSIFANYNELVVQDRFEEWKQQARALKDNLTHGDFSLETETENLAIKKVYQILSLITGLRETLLNSCDTWYEAVAALLAFGVRETASDAELRQRVLALAVAAHPPPGGDNWERTCLDIMEGNFLKVLRAIEVLDAPAAAYVSRMFEAKGFLDQYKEHTFPHASNLDDLSGYFLREHAFTCLESESTALKAIGVGLLVHLNTALSRAAVANYLANFPFTTNDDLEWALAVAAKLDLVSISQSLYRSAAHQSLREGRLLEALVMFSKGGDVSSITHNCWLVFEKALLDGCPLDDRSINDVVAHQNSMDLPAVVTQCLAPYAVLIEFYDQRGSDSSRQAALKLFNLLRFPHLPKSLFPLLAANLLPFITVDFLARLLTLQELIMMILILDNYEADPGNREDAEALYAIALTGGSGEAHDWRVRLEAFGQKPPASVADLVLTLRRKIAIQVSNTFLEEV